MEKNEAGKRTGKAPEEKIFWEKPPEEEKETEPEEKKFLSARKTPLTWSLITFLILCWILPLMVIVYTMLSLTTTKINDQIERTIVTSADNAIKICEMQMNAAVAASRRASSLPTLRECYKQYEKDGNRSALFTKATAFLEQNYCNDDDFLSTVLIFTEEPEELYYVSRSGSTNNPSYKQNLRFKEKVQPLIMEIYPELDTDIKFINVDNHIYMIRNIMSSAFHPYAVIVMELDKESIFGSLESTWGYTAGEIYIDKELLVSDKETELGQDSLLFVDREVPDAILNANNRTAKLIQNGNEFYAYAVRKPDRHSIGYIIQLDRQAIMDATENIKLVSATFLLFMIPLVITVFLFFHKKITQPVGRLVKASNIIEEGNFGYQIKRKANSREFNYLMEAFNSMSTRLKHQFETIYSEELALKDARIMALQSQINPHFLNNTLEIINWEARINENYKVSRMIENLSIMLEATMDRRHRRFVTLAEEMSYVEAYLFIIAQRLGERLRVDKNVDETLFNVKVPRLIIQPIIENAVEHGISGQTHGRININVFAQDDKLIIEVRNTGRMSQKDEEKIAILLGDDYEPGEFGSASLGIRNVNRRIKIIYGDTCGLYIQNGGEDETVSTIIVKLDYDNNKRQ